MKNRRLGAAVPFPARVAACLSFLLLGGCFGPDLTPGAESLAGPAVSPERAAALAEIRQKGDAADSLPYPDAYQSAQSARLAARPEPMPAAEAQAIQAELTAIAELQRAAGTPEELAELEARAAALRQRSIEDRAGRLRR